MSLNEISADTFAYVAFAIVAIVAAVAKFGLGMDSLFGVPINVGVFAHEDDHEVDD